MQIDHFILLIKFKKSNYTILVTYIDVAWFQEIGKLGVQVFGQWNISKHPIRNVEKLKIIIYLFYDSIDPQ